MRLTRGKIHEYLGMTLDFSVIGEVSITMIPYLTEIINLFEQYDDSDKTAVTPALENLFKVNNNAVFLSSTTLLPRVSLQQNKQGPIFPRPLQS